MALLRLAVELADAGVALLDVQWLTEHLGSLGAYEVPRAEYLGRLSVALELPPVVVSDAGGHGSAWTGRRPLLKAWDVGCARHTAGGTLSGRGGADA